MSRAEQIQGIINNRKPYADRLKSVKDKLDKLVSDLKELEKRKDTITKEVNDNETIERLRNIELSKLIETLEGKSANLKNLVKRFSRPTLNIGVFGEMGQGKSTLLQKLTGLPDNVIPARSGRACTAARSIIQHQPEGETKAKVRFHSKKTFLEQIILPYYKTLGLKPDPASFEAFANTTPPALPDDDQQTSSGIYQRFRNDYWSNADQYKALLDKEELLVTEEEKIKTYVAQEYGAEGNITNPECLAVREVEISCKFPNSDIGNIALLDIPGLGDFRLGDEKLLLETMGQYVDIVLFIRKPDLDRDQWKPRDTDLYDLAKKSLNDLGNRCFIVLNLNNNASNRETCEILEQELRNKQDLIPVVSCITADCSDKNQPNDLVLEPVLKHLETEITNLDGQYARDCLSSITQLEDEVKAMLLQANNALENFANEAKKFNELFAGKDERSGLWGELTSELGKVLDKLENNRAIHHDKFKEGVEDTIKKCKENTGIPSKEDIEKQRYALGGYPDAYYTYLREIRSNLSKHFLDLDADLQTTLEGVKIQVTTVLAEKGRLKDLSQKQGSEFFREIVNQLPDKNDRSSLWLAFHTIGQFNVSFAGTILRKVRKHFSELFSNTNTKANFSQAEANTSKADANTSKTDADKVLENLNNIHAQVIENCEKELETLYTEPNEIAYFMVQEFCDRVFYAKGAKLEWREFLEAKKDRVWPEFKQLAARTKIKQEWEILVNQADEANKQLLQFLLSLN